MVTLERNFKIGKRILRKLYRGKKSPPLYVNQHRQLHYATIDERTNRENVVINPSNLYKRVDVSVFYTFLKTVFHELCLIRKIWPQRIAQ